jgi:hypothetical protein
MKRLDQFDTLIKNINFKNTDKSYLLKLYKKHSWLNESLFLMNIIIMKTIN